MEGWEKVEFWTYFESRTKFLLRSWERKTEKSKLPLKFEAKATRNCEEHVWGEGKLVEG